MLKTLNMGAIRVLIDLEKNVIFNKERIIFDFFFKSDTSGKKTPFFLLLNYFLLIVHFTFA